MNELIEKIFQDFEVDKIRIPVSFIDYCGNEETYVTWQSTGNTPIYSADDEIIASSYEIDIDIFSKGNYLSIMKAIKEKMKDNDFIWVSDSPDMYENDTGYYHKTISFEKEIIL